MYVYQLINKFNNPFIHKYFATIFYESLIKNQTKELPLQSELEERYANLFNDLITMQPKNRPGSFIKVRRIYDKDEPSDFGYFWLDVILMENEEEYSVMALDWEDILGCEIEKESLEVYGAEACLYGILYELTWYGWTYEKFKENVNRLLQRLDEAEKEVELGHTISFEEICNNEEIRLEEPTEEEYKSWESVININRSYLEDIFSEK